MKDYIADGSGNLVATENAPGGACTTCYYGTDHLGSVRLVMDQNATVVSRHDYLAYGEEIAASTAGRDGSFGWLTDVTEKFTGQIRDQESGEDYFNARFFTAPLGRFNSPDPGNAGANLLSSQSWNGYAYVEGNPLNSVDPSGMEKQTYDGDFCATGVSCSWRQFWCYLGGGGGGEVESGGQNGIEAPYNLGLLFTATGIGVGDRNPKPISTPSTATLNKTSTTCYSLAAGQAPSGGLKRWIAGFAMAGLLTDMFEYGIGPSSVGFGPNSIQAQEMMSSPLVQKNISTFLGTGSSSMNDFQNFSIPQLWATGNNPTAQFIGSYGWAASQSNGVLTFAMANTTSFDSLFYHVTGRKWDRSKFPLYGNVHQTIVFQVPCGSGG